jgi:hypothetical protein
MDEYAKLALDARMATAQIALDAAKAALARAVLPADKLAAQRAINFAQRVIDCGGPRDFERETGEDFGWRLRGLPRI